MKALFINSVCGIRSTGRIMMAQAEQLEDKGAECMLAYGRETVPPECEEKAYRIGSDFEVRRNALMARIFGDEGFHAENETRRFLQWADAYDPDLVWLHNLHGYYINVEMLFQWIKSRPQMRVRWTLHDCWAFTGHCAHFSYVGCDRWKHCCDKCPQTKEYPKSWLPTHCATNYQRKKSAFCGVKNMTLITPSAWLSRLVKESFLKDYPIEIVPNKIDKTVFKPTSGNFREKYGLNGKTIILGVASAWSNRKGLPDFIRLSEMLDETYVIVLVGLTKKQIAQIPHSILCIGQTNSKAELAQIYTSADVFVNLTYEDTYPTVNLEAAACGTPVITYDTGGSPETVSPDSVIRQGDLNALTDKLKKLKATDEHIIFRHGV